MYDLAKANALVKQLGGLSFTMYYLQGGIAGGQQETVALQTMFEQAGMHVKIIGIADLGQLVAEYNTHTWQVIPAGIGSYETGSSIGGLARGARPGLGAATGRRGPRTGRSRRWRRDRRDVAGSAARGFASPGQACGR